VVNRIHIIGRKKSGKTTLVVDLVKALSHAGYRVATVKHTHHHHELDTPGKDSHRHREAGAVAVGILAPAMTAVFLPQDRREDAAGRYDDLIRALGPCDLVLVEGDIQTAAPKIEVWRAATETEPLAAQDRSILAVVTDDPVQVDVPVWARSDVRLIAERIGQVAGI
jgi:molybdopterin-guanine dinucleotide biosynthesis protein MobB